MRILLAQNSLYYPAHGGGDKSNRLLMEALAARGHECRAVARISVFGEAEHRRTWRTGGARRDAAIGRRRSGGLRARGRRGPRGDQRATCAPISPRRSEAFRPDVILASTDDPAQLLLEAALRARSARVVYLARATLALPFGPDCAFPSEAKTERIRAADARGRASASTWRITSASYAGIDAVHVPISLMEPRGLAGPGPLRQRIRHPGESVRRERHRDFPGAGRCFPADGLRRRAHLGHQPSRTAPRSRARPNIRLLDPVDDIDAAAGAHARAAGAVAVGRSALAHRLEAMLRGVPVMAANVGGIPEAKMGVPYLLPVQPHREIPDRAWTSRWCRWRRCRRRISAPGARRWPPAERPRPLLRDLRTARAAPRCGTPPTYRRAVRSCSWKLRAAFAQSRDRQGAGRRATNSPPRSAGCWRSVCARRPPPPPGSPVCRPRPRPRLFCFPHAGGGAAGFRRWRSQAGRSAPCACRAASRASPKRPSSAWRRWWRRSPRPSSPGSADPSRFSATAWVPSSASSWRASCARAVCRCPRMLVASAARAPQFRRELRAAARALRGAAARGTAAAGRHPRGGARSTRPCCARSSRALEADAALYRNYVFRRRAACVPHPRLRRRGRSQHTPEHLEGWAEQTTASFAVRFFPAATSI